MKKEEFFKQLEYLLQDIPDEDREEALDYYRDYLEEAGSGNEEQAIDSFGSPERVAAMIRADLSGNLKNGGEFTETGYEDERFRDPNYQIARRLDLPDEKETDGTFCDGSKAGPKFREKYTRSRTADRPWTNKGLKLVLWIILIIVASPFILGAAGVALGTAAGVAALVVGILAVLLCLTAAAFIIGVGLLALGIAFLVSAPFDSLFLFGIAVAGIGCGLIGAVILCFIMGVFFPLLWKGIKMLAGSVSGLWKEVKKA